MKRREETVADLEEVAREISEDRGPKFQFDYAGRIWKRGHGKEWAIHEEGNSERVEG